MSHHCTPLLLLKNAANVSNANVDSSGVFYFIKAVWILYLRIHNGLNRTLKIFLLPLTRNVEHLLNDAISGKIRNYRHSFLLTFTLLYR